MSVLKFRVIFEEDDSIHRDVEIKPVQTFENLETVIMLSYNIPAGGGGVFFMSNDSWQKLRQIYPPLQTPPKEEKKTRGKAKAVKGAPLVTFIDDPHQHFIYEFSGKQDFTFLVQLVSLGGTEKPDVMYPVQVKAQGPSPFKKEEMAVHLAKNRGEILSIEKEDIEADDTLFIAEEDEGHMEELASIGEEEGDLMEGDVIKEEVEEEATDDTFVAGDDFNPEDPEDLSESISEDLEEDV